MLVLVQLCCLFIFAVQAADPGWIRRFDGCGFAHCIEIDFTQVPAGFDMLGSNPNFTSMFLLQAADGPEPGTDPPNCVHDTPGQEGVVKCLFNSGLVRVRNSVLELKVTGPTSPRQTVGVAQVTFYDPTLANDTTLVSNGFFEVVAKTPELPGTCVGIFTQAFPPPPVHWDEQDIEILTAHYTKPDQNVSAGIHLTSWNAFPANSSDRNVDFSLPFVFDPPSDFFAYSIFWDNKVTIYSWGDGKKKNR